MKRVLTLMLALLMLLTLFSGCKKEEVPTTTDGNPLVTIEMQSGDKIYIELYPDVAPNTVNNFVYLAEQGYYDGLTFHRVIEGLIIQGGDPQGTGRGGPGYNIPGEMTNNGFENTLSHTAGVISMARKATGYDTAGSQFFIMVGEYPMWDGEYCGFGKVIQGLEYVEEMSGLDVEKDIKKLTMKEVTVDTFGVDYPEPEVIR